ncbi:Hsp70 family protein [Cryptosporangium japonicum]|uniref:Uncharacterized protein n=1 Tax=Cryptosporangium japonicum TaxID=80872 RepID=A0ABP3EUV9_9ACTN
MDEPLHRVIGIDLGTTYSAVAAYNDDDVTPELIPDRSVAGGAGAATPSVVLRNGRDGIVTVGHAAKDAMAAADPDLEILIEIKREMGVEFSAETLDRFDAAPAFRPGDPLQVRLGEEWLRPQEVSALVLMRMKDIAERRIGAPVHDAVVTVPAYFSERQKQATAEAALLAGLYPRRLIAEPTAAAICYGVDRADAGRQVYLVYDLGGGTFDVSIIETRSDSIEVIATAGDRRLGGGDVDAAIAEWLGKRWGLDPGGPDRLPLRAAAERAKRDLSYGPATTVALPGHAPVVLDRSTLERLIAPILERTLVEVEKALEYAAAKGVRRDELDAVLLVGGSTKVPRVRPLLLEHFGKDDAFVRADGNPDTLVARGAAQVAREYDPSASFDLEWLPESAEPVGSPLGGPRLTLITEHTLGIAAADDEESNKFSKLIHISSKIPASQTRRYTNPDLADRVTVQVFQGEAPYVWDNERIGVVTIPEVDPQPKGFHDFDVTFALTVDGLLDVSVVHVNTGESYRASFDRSTAIGQKNELAARQDLLLRWYRTGAEGATRPCHPRRPSSRRCRPATTRKTGSWRCRRRSSRHRCTGHPPHRRRRARTPGPEYRTGTHARRDGPSGSSSATRSPDRGCTSRTWSSSPPSTPVPVPSGSSRSRTNSRTRMTKLAAEQRPGTVAAVETDLGATYAGPGMWGTVYLAPAKQRCYRLIPAD